MAFVAPRPGIDLDPDELVAFCRERIPERAAVPVRIVVLNALPTTAVGKVFKPELRRRAIELVLHEALAEASIETEVAAAADERRGTVVRVRLSDPAQRDAAKRIVDRFALSCEIE
jgi:fatty-acyl-CoA synthase